MLPNDDLKGQVNLLCCSVLQYVAMCCSVLQYVAVSLHRLDVYCCVLYPYTLYFAVCCSILQCAALQYIAVVW